jgi:hypothetical protein
MPEQQRLSVRLTYTASGVAVENQQGTAGFAFDLFHRSFIAYKQWKSESSAVFWHIAHQGII